jgi:hypothetical protein
MWTGENQVTELKSKQETKAKHRENIKDLREKFSL